MRTAIDFYIVGGKLGIALRYNKIEWEFYDQMALRLKYDLQMKFLNNTMSCMLSLDASLYVWRYLDNYIALFLLMN